MENGLNIFLKLSIHVFVFLDLLSVDDDVSLQMLNIIMDVEIVFVNRANDVISLPSLRRICSGLWLFCLKTIKLTSLLLQIISEIILLPLQSEELSFLQLDLY
jgi:hypothetical protein